MCVLSDYLRYEPPAVRRTARNSYTDVVKIAPPPIGYYPAVLLKNLLPTSKNIIQCFLEMRRRFRELTPDLRYVLLVALLDFVFE